MRKTALLIVLMLALNAAAIEKFQEQPNIPADAKPTAGEDISEAPAAQPAKTNITIERVIPQEVKAGDVFNVTLKVTNHHTSELNILVVDPQRQGITYVGGPEPYTVKYEGLEIPLFRWMERISPGETRDYTYQIKAGNPGTITFPPASVNDDYGNTFESKPAFVTVECKPTGRCSPGESYINCPRDCPTGSKDDVCDGVVDGRVDPDCTSDADPDSAKAATTTLPATKPLSGENTPVPWCNILALPLYSILLAVMRRMI